MNNKDDGDKKMFGVCTKQLAFVVFTLVAAILLGFFIAKMSC